MIRYVVLQINDISSESKRRQFQKRLLSRIEDECILSELIGTEEVTLDVDEVHAKTIELVKKSDNELLESLADTLPESTPRLIKDVVDYSIKGMRPSDLKLLPAPEEKPSKMVLGKKAKAALKRIGWRTFCDKESAVNKAWSEKIPEVFDKKYFSLSIITTMADWKIGLGQVAAGIAATAMRYGCEEFCSQLKPEGLMIPSNEKE